MKFPKNRANVFAVVRSTLDVNGDWSNSVLLGVFSNYSDASDYAGACTQEWVDKGGDARYVNFKPELTTFYG